MTRTYDCGVVVFYIITKEQIHFSGVHFNDYLRLEEHCPAFTSEDFVLVYLKAGIRS